MKMYCDMTAGIVQQKAAIIRQWHGKHIPTATNKHTITEKLLELMLYISSMQRLRSVDLALSREENCSTCKTMLSASLANFQGAYPFVLCI